MKLFHSHGHVIGGGLLIAGTTILLLARSPFVVTGPGGFFPSIRLVAGWSCFAPDSYSSKCAAGCLPTRTSSPWQSASLAGQEKSSAGLSTSSFLRWS